MGHNQSANIPDQICLIHQTHSTLDALPGPLPLSVGITSPRKVVLILNYQCLAEAVNNATQ